MSVPVSEVGRVLPIKNRKQLKTTTREMILLLRQMMGETDEKERRQFRGRYGCGDNHGKASTEVTELIQSYYKALGEKTLQHLRRD